MIGRLGRVLGALPPLNLWVRTAPAGAEYFCWRIELSVERASIILVPVAGRHGLPFGNQLRGRNTNRGVARQ